MNRRELLYSLAAVAAMPAAAFAQTAPLLTRKIPSTGEALPAVGLGSWKTFNVGGDAESRRRCAAVVSAFLQNGGKLIDSSPMYGSAQEVIGDALRRLGKPAVFSADKVWTSGSSRGVIQIEESRRQWGVAKFDLLQVHNLLDWESHLPILFSMKKTGKLRYVGVTTSHGRRHEDLEAILRSQPLDFVQLTYNPLDREVEARLLPLAQQRRIAVIVNRPFQQGELTDRLQRHPLPQWARSIDATSWAQLILKFIVSHPAVTCAIPATSVPAHAKENMDAGRGRMPDAATRKRIVDAIEKLA